MLGPHLRGYRIRELIAVRVCSNTGRGIDTKMRMSVDDAGCYPFAVRIDHGRVGWCSDVCTDFGDLAVTHQNRTTLNYRTRGGKNRRIGNERGPRWQWLVCGRER